MLNELSIEVQDDLNRRRKDEGEESEKLPSMIIDYFNKIIS